MTLGLTLCMMVRNEAAVLQDCLESAAGLVDEILVVDTGSTDSTPQIAARYGARVLSFDFTRIDFAAARNLGLSEATGNCILVLDADETLHAESRSRVETLVLENENTGYYFERHNHGRQTTCDYVVRLFPRRPEYRFKGRVHETVDASILNFGGRLHQTTLRIDHNFTPSALKHQQYSEILREEIAADPSDLTRLDFLAAEYHQMEMFAEAATIAEHLATVRPLDARAQLFAGVYHLLYQPDHDKARAELYRALELRPGYPEAISFLELLTPVA